MLDLALWPGTPCVGSKGYTNSLASLRAARGGPRKTGQLSFRSPYVGWGTTSQAREAAAQQAAACLSSVGSIAGRQTAISVLAHVLAVGPIVTETWFDQGISVSCMFVSAVKLSSGTQILKSIVYSPDDTVDV